jgi:uncharacterized membrane protein YjfL (UPF0719 family)
MWPGTPKVSPGDRLSYRTLTSPDDPDLTQHRESRDSDWVEISTWPDLGHQPWGTAAERRAADGGIKEYGISLGWVVCFLVPAIVARCLFDWMTPFSLRDASAQKNAAIGRVLRGLYLGLAIILAAAMYSTHSILIALRDGAVGIVLMLLMFKICDLIDRRDFARELADGNAMLGMELEGLFILLSAVIFGSMIYVRE